MPTPTRTELAEKVAELEKRVSKLEAKKLAPSPIKRAIRPTTAKTKTTKDVV